MDIALKQRLVGASVLVALAVVVIPMLLGGRPEEDRDTRRIEVPEQPPETAFETRRYPVGKSPRPVQEGSDEPIRLPAPAETGVSQQPDRVEAEAQDLEEPDSSLEPERDVAQAQDDEAQARAAERPVQAAPAALEPETGGRYLVQVASFLSKDTAAGVERQLSEQGFTIRSDTVTAEAGTLHRVRVGPFATETEAKQAMQNVRANVSDVSPRLVDLKPEQSAPVTQPSDPMVRWVVQVAVLSTAGKADDLVARLKLEGLGAYRETLERNGSQMFRVRVGPYIEREEALRVERLIEQRMSIDSMVMSAD